MKGATRGVPRSISRCLRAADRPLTRRACDVADTEHGDGGDDIADTAPASVAPVAAASVSLPEIPIPEGAGGGHVASCRFVRSHLSRVPRDVHGANRRRKAFFIRCH